MKEFHKDFEPNQEQSQPSDDTPELRSLQGTGITAHEAEPPPISPYPDESLQRETVAVDKRNAEAAPEQHVVAEESEYVQAIRQAMHLESAFVVEQRAKLREAAESVAGRIVNPMHQKAAQTYAAIADWTFFGKPGDPLPAGLVIDENTSDTIYLDPRISTLRTLVQFDQPFIIAGVGEIRDVISEKLNEGQGDVEATIREYIVNSGGYEVLSALGSPQRVPEATPLTPYWQQVRAQQLLEGVQSRYGTMPGEPLLPGSPADQELQRRIRQLDDEEQPLPARPENDYGVLRHAREYLGRYVTDAFNNISQTTDGFSQIVHNPNTHELEIETLDGSTVGFYMVITLAAERFAEDWHTGAESMRFVSRDYVTEVISRLLDPFKKAGVLQDILDDAATEVATMSWRSLARAATVAKIGAAYLHGRKDHALLLRQPGVHEGQFARGAIGLGGRTGGDQPETMFETFADNAPSFRLRNDASRRLGSIERYDPGNFRVPARLLLLQELDAQLPPRANQEDLAITYTSPGAPFIPGYTLVSHDAQSGRFGFVVDPNGDPYMPCDVPIDQERRIALAAKYESIGLSALATRLRDAPTLTVEQLTAMVADTVEYYIPMHQPATPSGFSFPQRRTFMENIEGFAQTVRDGKLLVQCTGASGFLAQSLEELFGPQCTASAGGFVLSGKSVLITGTRHLQTVFMHSGRQYILDATPPADFLDYPDDAVLVEAEYTTDRTRASAPILQHPPKPAEATRPLYPQKGAGEQAAEMLSNFTEQLRISFRQPHADALREYVARLPEHDPARRSLELLILANQGSGNGGAVQRLAAFIEDLVTAEDDVRQSLGYAEYSKDFLERLRTTARRIAALFPVN